MPCRSDYMEPTATEYATTNALNKDLKTLADKLTAANDVLREFILDPKRVNVLPYVNHPYAHAFSILEKKSQGLYVSADSGLIQHVRDLVKTYQWLNTEVVDKPDSVRSSTVLNVVLKQQEEHREADLTRLMKTFADKGDRVRLRKVLDADPTKPLKPQLGFDADEF